MIISYDYEKFSISNSNHCINLDKEILYDVYAIEVFRENISYLVYNKYFKPEWINSTYTIIIDSIIPPGWHYKKDLAFDLSDVIYIGYKEIVINKNHYRELFVDKTPEALFIFDKERELRTAKIDQFDLVKLLSYLPEGGIPAGSLGIVTEPPDLENRIYTVSFYMLDGSESPPVKVPRVYLALDSKT